MDMSRWISLIAVVFYLTIFVFVPVSGGGSGAHPKDGRLFIADFVGGFLLFTGFVCTWWSEALGDALWVGRGAWNPKPSSSGAVKMLGWIFLVLAFAVHTIVRRWLTAHGVRQCS
jgi:hypothetical protein